MNDETKSNASVGIMENIPWAFVLRYVGKNTAPLAVGVLVGVAAIIYVVFPTDLFKGHWFGQGGEPKDVRDHSPVSQEDLIKALTTVLKPALSEVDKASPSQEKLERVAKDLHVLNSKLPAALDTFSSKLDKVISKLVSLKYDREQDSEARPVQFGGGDLCPSTLTRALLDLSGLEQHINRWGSVKVDTAPEVMVLRIRIILRHLNWVNNLEGDRENTSHTLQRLQRWLNQNGFANIPSPHYGYFGKKTVQAVRALLMESGTVACGSGSGCFGMANVN